MRPLTPNELAVLDALGRGELYKTIASSLGVSENTAKTWGKRLFKKLGVYDRLQAVAEGHRRRLIGRGRVGPRGMVSDEQWAALKREHDERCAYCRVAGVELVRDHKIPLHRGGEDVVGNVLPACRPCRAAKGTMTALEFIDQRRRSSPSG